MTHWEIKRETVYHLYRDGSPVRDTSGNVVHYPSVKAAEQVAATWAATRNWYDELRAMSAKELDVRIAQAGWLAAVRRRLWGWAW